MRIFPPNAASQIASRATSNDAYANTGHYNVDRNYAVNGLNQYTSAGPAVFGYDPNGNLTSDGAVTFTKTHENRLVKASGAKNAELVYDPLGRLWEMYPNASAATSLPRQRFLYDGDALVAEYTDSGSMGRLTCPLLPTCGDTEAVFKAIARIRVRGTQLRVRLELAALLGKDEIDDDVLDRARQMDPAATIDRHHLIVSIASGAVRRGSVLSAPDHITSDTERRRLLADLIRKSHQQLKKLHASLLHPDEHCHMTAPINEWGRQRVAIGLLAPDIQKMLLQGKAPPHITPDVLLNSDIPMDWEEQRRMFGLG